MPTHALLENEGRNTSVSSHGVTRRIYCAASLLLLLWLLAFFQAIQSAVAVWLVSDTFTHCFFILPISLYLISRQAPQLLQESPRPNYWVLVLLLPCLLIGLLGSAGDLQLFTHVAAFTSLPLCVWLLIGNRAVKKIYFPLLFILFSIPIGDELIPLFQEITADMSVALLQLSGVPVYRNGLYLDIPEGRFLVAEACSGVRFFVTSIVFGSLYAHFSFRTLPRQIVFIAIAVVVPIFANAGRVYGLIMIGHLSDMEHAVGTDHLTFGWFFFAIIMVILVVIGELMRNRSDKSVRDATTESGPPHSEWAARRWHIPLTIVSVLLLSHILWHVTIGAPGSADDSNINRASLPISTTSRTDQLWQPLFDQPNDQLFAPIVQAPATDLFLAWYDGSSDAELVSSSNRLYDPENWSLVSSEVVEFASTGALVEAKLLTITNSQGTRRLVLYWYELPNYTTHRSEFAKLYQAANALVGNSNEGGIIALSQEDVGSQGNARSTILALAEAHYRSIKQSLPGMDSESRVMKQ